MEEHSDRTVRDQAGKYYNQIETFGYQLGSILVGIRDTEDTADDINPALAYRKAMKIQVPLMVKAV
jgi:hypothetical protein